MLKRIIRDHKRRKGSKILETALLSKKAIEESFAEYQKTKIRLKKCKIQQAFKNPRDFMPIVFLWFLR